MSSLSPRDMRQTLILIIKKNLRNVLSNKQNCMHGSMVCVSRCAQSTPDVTKNE